ncbi:hypothetical protein B0H19DRAFT_1263353 [Mycena capillaripes]|nr:hypothetical protein B0H19DRAFT_1263353 [Mycena capillaripes]
MLPGQRRLKRVGATGGNVGHPTYDPSHKTRLHLPQFWAEFLHLKRFLTLQHPLSTSPLLPGQHRLKRVGATGGKVGHPTYDPPHKAESPPDVPVVTRATPSEMRRCDRSQRRTLPYDPF